MNHAKIILVDDDSALLESICELLTDDGYEIHPFDNGKDALSMFRKETVDLVLTDIKMPGMTGIQLLEEIRAIDQETPVLLATGYAELDMAVAAVKMGASDFIVKPYKISNLVKAIEKSVQYSRRRRAEKIHNALLEKEVERTTHDLISSFEVVDSMSRVVIELLSLANSSQDAYTTMQNARVAMVSGKIARALAMPEDFVETITAATAMHSMWKRVIPRPLLVKLADLTDREFQVMQMRPEIKETSLIGTTYPALRMAALVALTYQERWDGTGIPNGLSGDEIPLAGRIVMLAEYYSDLRITSFTRTDHETACRTITEGDGATNSERFDPDVMKAFMDCADSIGQIYDARVN